MEKTKKCRSCTDMKSYDEFYKHSNSADGHLNVCIPCKKKQTLERYNSKKDDPIFLAQEAARKREAYNKK